MPTLPFPDDVRALLLQPNPSVVSTLRADGAPISVATWYLLEEDDRVLLDFAGVLAVRSVHFLYRRRESIPL